MERWHLLSRSQNQDCLSNGRNGQTKQDLAVQHHQLRKQVQVVQVPCHRRLPLAVRHGPCLLTLKKRIQAFETKCVRKFLCISYLEHKFNDWVQSKIIFLVRLERPLQATVQRRKLAWYRHVKRHDSLSQNHPSRYLGGRATPWSAEEMLDGQHQRVDISTHARAAHKGLLRKILKEDHC